MKILNRVIDWLYEDILVGTYQLISISFFSAFAGAMVMFAILVHF